MSSNGKVIIISAPSGCGKSTIIGRIIHREDLRLSFSISATSRKPRGEETHGREYYFLSEQEFRDAIEQDAFVEFEEVYPGRFYGTLRSEVERLRAQGRNVILDIDVRGGVNVKHMFGSEALAIFIEPPSIEELRRRLEGRGTDSPQEIDSRVGRAEYELSFAPQYDIRIVNDNLDRAVEQTATAIAEFIE